jgi:hypothetical protein
MKPERKVLLKGQLRPISTIRHMDPVGPKIQILKVLAHMTTSVSDVQNKKRSRESSPLCPFLTGFDRDQRESVQKCRCVVSAKLPT